MGLPQRADLVRPEELPGQGLQRSRTAGTRCSTCRTRSRAAGPPRGASASRAAPRPAGRAATGSRRSCSASRDPPSTTTGGRASRSGLRLRSSWPGRPGARSSGQTTATSTAERRTWPPPTSATPAPHVPEPAQVLHAQPGVVHHQLLPERQRVAPAGDRLQLLRAAGHHRSVRRRARGRRRRVVDVQQHPAGASR